MELRGLRYFLAVAQELHFGRAAARLHISQPPLTEHIKRLEAELGVQLFQRTKRSVKITPAGTALLLEAQRVLGDIESMQQVVRLADHGMNGILRAGFMSSATYAGIGSVSKHLMRHLPDMSITWHGMTTSEQVLALQSMQIDLGFLHLPCDARGLQVRPITRDVLVVVLHASHPLARHRTISLIDLRDDDFVLPPRASAPGLHDLITSTCRDAGFSPLIRHRARDLLSIISLISVGSGVSLVPRWLSNTRFPNIGFRPLRQNAPIVEFSVAWNPENPSPVLRRTIEVLAPTFEKFQ